MSSKGRAGKESAKATESALGNDAYLSDVFSLPSGFLNPLEPPIAITDRLSLSDSTTSLLRATVKKSNTPDLTTGISHFKGIVLRIEAQSESSFLSSVTDAIGLTKTEGYIKARVLVPEMHKMLPRPFGKGHPEYPKTKNENDLVIDLYPIYESINNSAEFSEIKVGDIVTVSYRSKNNYTTSGTPIIVAPYASSLANIGKALDCVDSNQYNAGPPPGDPLADGQRRTSHTGGDSAALRSRNKRSVSQFFLHSASGEALAQNLVTIASSRGYTVKTSDINPGSGATITDYNGSKYYSHNLTLSNFLAADELLVPEGEHFLKSAENITISYRLPYDDAASLQGYNGEIDKVKKVFKQLIELIDSRCKGAPNINFILDPNWDLWSDIRIQACKNLKDDTTFKSQFTNGTLRINFFDTIPTSNKGTFDYGRQASTKLGPNEAAIFAQNMAPAFKQQGNERAAIKKKPAPTVGPKIKPAPPSASDIDGIIRGVLTGNQFSSLSDAEQFLNAISTKLNVDLDAIITADPNDPNSFLNAGITPDLAVEVAGQSIPPSEIPSYIDQIKQKIISAVEFSTANAFVNPASEPQTPIPANNFGVPKRSTPRAAASNPVGCEAGVMEAQDVGGDADSKGIRKQTKVQRSYITSGARPGVTQERYAFRRKRKRKSTSYVIIHNPGDEMRSPGSLANNLNAKGLGVHFVVTSNGKTVQLCDMNKALVHAKGVNDDSIGIEVQNPSKQGITNRKYTPTTAAACEATWQLVKKICKNSSIPLVFPPASTSRGTFYNGWRSHRYGGLRPGVLGHGHFEAHPLKQHGDGKLEILYMALRKRGLSASNAYAIAVKTEKAYSQKTPKGQRAKGHRLGFLKVPALKTGTMTLVDIASDLGIDSTVFVDPNDKDGNGVPDLYQRPDESAASTTPKVAQNQPENSDTTKKES